MLEWLLRHVNIRAIGLILIVATGCFCLRKITDSNWPENTSYTTELKLVNVFARHGDRSPSEALPPGDRHAQRINFFWPNGMSDLTDAGLLRLFRLGRALRRRYARLMNDRLLDSNNMLAFSSAVNRCIKSTEETLRGFYNIDQSTKRGLRLLEYYQENCLANSTSGHKCQLPSGSGSPTEWKQVQVDTKSVPSLDWRYIESCWAQIGGVSAIDSDLLQSKAVAELDGVMELKAQLEASYNQSFDFPIIDHWSGITNEIRLERTQDTVSYVDHFANWINRRITVSQSTLAKLAIKLSQTVKHLEHRLPTLYDIYEALYFYVWRDRVPEGAPSLLQLGPLLSSLIDSQQMALSGAKSATSPKFVDQTKATMYTDKKVILYFTHDNIINSLMYRLQLIADNGESHLERFLRDKDRSRREQFLDGLRMAEFGTTLVFELYEMKKRNTNFLIQAVTSQTDESFKKWPETFAYVQAALYFEEDPLEAPISFKKLELGTTCRNLFRLKFPSISDEQMMEMFYTREFIIRRKFDWKLSCPFELFRNVTMQDYAIDSANLESICPAKQAYS